MKLLYLAHRIPYPPNKGDKIRSFNEIKYLSRSYKIDLACLADNAQDLRYEEDLNRYCKRVKVAHLGKSRAMLRGMIDLFLGKAISVGYFYSPTLQKTVDQWLANTNYDAIICFSSPMAEYVFRSKKVWIERVQGTGYKVEGKKKGIFGDLEPCTLHRRPVLVMDFCDVDSDKWGQYAALTRFPKSFVYRLENKRLAAYERKIAERFDYSVFVSEKEAEIFKKQNPHISNIAVIPNGVDYEYFSPGTGDQGSGIRNKETEGSVPHVSCGENAPIPPTSNLKPQSDSMPHAPCPMLLFTGAMDYHANVDGVTWFCNDIYPEIRRKVPNIEFYIVGSNPHSNVRQLNNHSGIKVTGFVEDIRPYYHMADVCVIPLRLARGVQNKVLEAMSSEKPVVTTSQAIQGIGAVDGEHLVVANEHNSFAQAVVTLLKDSNRRRRLRANARQFVKANYSWKKNMTKLEELILGGVSSHNQQGKSHGEPQVISSQHPREQRCTVQGPRSTENSEFSLCLAPCALLPAN